MKDVEFQDVVYTVKHRKTMLSEAKKRTLLHGVSGVFRHGQLAAIMGPSGAGKSSLLNAISGYCKQGVTGQIKLNHRTSCYIQQEDVHQSLLTVNELMSVACSLKVKRGASHSEIINDILSSLNLTHAKDVTADRLSGGERKRLSIALELVANPSIFFLDEPTSGLDEVTAASCIRLLKALAKQGRTVVCTIHQPSAATFLLFDQIFVLAQGQCVYHGDPGSLVPFLSNVNLECPRHYNPSDFIIELCDGDDETVIPMLADVFQNGKLICSRVTESTVSNVTDFQNNEPSYINEEDLRNGYTLKYDLTSLTLEKDKPKGGTLLQKMKTFSRLIGHSDHAKSSIIQFYVLFKLMMLRISRNHIALYIQFFHHMVCGLFIGIIFYKTADDGERMFDHLKYCMGVVFFIVYTQVMVPILNYPMEVKIVKKECFNRWYSLTPYYIALTLSRIPLQVFFNMIFLTLVYSLSGLPLQWWRFGMFALVGCIISLVAESLGLFIGATFSITNGCAIGPLFMAPFLGLAVYGFDFAADISLFMYGIMKFSFIRGGIVSLVLTVFGYDRKQLNCHDIYCHFDDPKVLLRYLRIEEVSVWVEIAFLVASLLFFRCVCYLSLRKRCHR